MFSLLRLTPLLLLGSVALAQTKPADLKLDPADVAAIIAKSADRIESSYVDAGVAKKIASHLREAAAKGAFASAHSALELVPLVNRELHPFGDAHLRFGYDPNPKPETSNDDEDDTPAEREAQRREAVRDAFGIAAVRRLPGNVGLLDYRNFQDAQITGDALGHAFELLGGTDALIIDLRENRGGAPETVALLLSYFAPEGKPLLVSALYFRAGDLTRQYWTASWLPSPRYVNKPLYVLTSSRTFSAAEGFTMGARRLFHAVIVGQKTRGGSHPSRWFVVHPNFAVSVPVARSVDQTYDWEGKGITPDVETNDDALRAAYLLALRELRSRATDASIRSELDDVIANPPVSP